MTGPGRPGWPTIAALVARELGGPVRDPQPLTPWRGSQTWAVRTDWPSELVIKVGDGDEAFAKTAWTAAHLPLLGARGYPVPTIVWHASSMTSGT